MSIHFPLGMATASGTYVPELPGASTTLPSGLRVRLVPLPHLQSATISFFVRVGSRYETPENNGISHFVEHMLYRGTERHRAAHELSLAIERLGGTLEAATHVDFTSYDLTLPSETLVDGLDLLAEVLREPLLSEIGTEKEIIREEILEDLNERGEQIDVDNVSRQLLYREHPLGFSIAGPLQNLDRFDVADLKRHHRNHYTARNSVLCVAGAFDDALVWKSIDRCFDGMPGGRAIAASPTSTEGGADRFRYVEEHGSQTDIRLSFHTPGIDSPSAPVFLLLERILDDGLSTRVHRILCEERGLAYDAFAAQDSFEDCGVFELGASVEHHKAPSLVEAALELIDDLRRCPPDDDEIDKAKRRHLWDLKTVRDDTEDAGHFVGMSALFGLPEELAVVAAQIAEVSAEDVLSAAQQYLDPVRAHLTCVGMLDDDLQRAIEDKIRD